jgi:hypothetical protein
MRENVKKTHSESLSSFETATLEILHIKSAKNQRKMRGKSQKKALEMIDF